MRRRRMRALVGRFGFAAAFAWSWGAPPVAAQQSCLPPQIVGVLDGVTDTRRAVEVLTDQLADAGDTLPTGLQNALRRVTKVLDQTASQVQIPQEQVVGLVCDILRVPDSVVDAIVDKLTGQAAAQSGAALLAANSLTGAILGRLDSRRVQEAGGGGSSFASSSGMMGLGATDKGRPAPPPGAAGPVTLYASGTFLGGNSTTLPDVGSISYHGGSGMLGLEYSVSRNLILGVAGSFTTMDASLGNGSSVGADVIHGAAYMSYATRQWFVDALAAYGAIGLDMARPGTESADVVRSSTDGGAWAVAARSGYLLDFGKVRAGPIAGLTYVNARIGGYSETDGEAVTKVGAQTVESLTGSAGLRFLAPFQADGRVFVPYLNVTLEHQFGDNTAELTASISNVGGAGTTQTLSFPTFGARDYGKVEGGITVELAPEASVSVSGATTFARDDGQDYRLSAGLNYRF